MLTQYENRSEPYFLRFLMLALSIACASCDSPLAERKPSGRVAPKPTINEPVTPQWCTNGYDCPGGHCRGAACYCVDERCSEMACGRTGSCAPCRLAGETCVSPDQCCGTCVIPTSDGYVPNHIKGYCSLSRWTNYCKRDAHCLPSARCLGGHCVPFGCDAGDSSCGAPLPADAGVGYP